MLRFFVFLLLLGILCTHAGTIDFPTAGQVIADRTFNDHTYNFTKVYANGATIVMDVTGSTVVGAGLRLQGTYSVPPDVGYDRVNFTMRDTKIEDTTIYIQGYFPRSSTVRISGTTATMKSATPVFSLVGHAPVFSVTIFIEDTKATWADATKNDAVMRLGGELRHWLNAGGAFYFVRTTATRAASIVKVVNPLCTRHFDSTKNIEFFSTPFEFCIDVYEGFFTIDYATCYDCTESLYLAESTCSFGCVNGMVRFSNNTITGGKPFMKCADPSHCMRCLNNGNYILSGIYTEGYLFDKSDYSGNANIIELERCKLTISHISAKAIHPPQLNNAPNYWSVNNVQEIAVMENVTLSGKKVAPTLAAYNAVGLNPSHVNDNGALKEKRASTDLGNIGDPSIGNCQAGKYESVKWEPDPLKPGVNWRPQCVCKAGYVEPYCTITYDPILYNSGYTYAPPACAVANCNSCQWGVQRHLLRLQGRLQAERQDVRGEGVQPRPVPAVRVRQRDGVRGVQGGVQSRDRRHRLRHDHPQLQNTREGWHVQWVQHRLCPLRERQGVFQENPELQYVHRHRYLRDVHGPFCALQRCHRVRGAPA
ncbi:hypothetical protein, conserved [Angomonas deanei]|uniref:Uncharacterized protein n=1 Tax=Angomonas deanei TaxID=59799 RepID=A0A7G2CFB7_9TRYP|nr:hypothetical protein, conserved [Angomonas deanei]